jgi:hypothetical protein
MQSERIEQRALHKHEQRGHLGRVQVEFFVLSLLLWLSGNGIRIGDGVRVRVCIRKGKRDVGVPGAPGDGRNVPVLIVRGHAPAAKDALDLLGRSDLAEEEEQLCAQGFRTEELLVSGECQGAQAAGRMKEESRHMVHLPESQFSKKFQNPKRSVN